MADKKIDNQYYAPPPKLGRWEGFCTFLWNSETGQFLGRTGSSWGKLLRERIKIGYSGCGMVPHSVGGVVRKRKASLGQEMLTRKSPEKLCNLAAIFILRPKEQPFWIASTPPPLPSGSEWVLPDSSKATLSSCSEKREAHRALLLPRLNRSSISLKRTRTCRRPLVVRGGYVILNDFPLVPVRLPGHI